MTWNCAGPPHAPGSAALKVRQLFRRKVVDGLRTNGATRHTSNYGDIDVSKKCVRGEDGEEHTD
jgi:hypothetical protein